MSQQGDSREMQNLRREEDINADVLSNWSAEDRAELYENTELSEEENSMKVWWKMGSPISGRGFILVLDMIEWAWDFFMLVANIVLSIHENNYTDVLATLLLHSISCIVLAAFEYSNLLVVPMGFPRFERKPKFLIIKFIFNFFTFWKPIWYYSTYRHNEDRNRVVKNQFQLRRRLTKAEIRCIRDIRREDLTKAHYKLIEVYVKNVPMALLQMYLTFKKNDSFKICTWEDANRVFMILSCIFSSAKVATAYTNNYMAYLKPLHFLDYCRSHFQRKINFHVQSTFSYLFAFGCHLLLSIHRFYAISFFLAIHRVLALVFILTLFISNWILLEVVISLRMQLENPPLGAPTFFSDLIDRWINVFTAHMIRFQSFSSRFLKFKNFRFRMWMGLLQIVPFLAAAFAVSLTSLGLKTSSGKAFEDRQYDDNTVQQSCNNWTITSNIKPINELGTFIFNAHNSLSNFHVSSLFSSLPFVTLSIYFYIIFSFLFSAYLNFFELDDVNFPVQIAFDFWRTLLEKEYKRQVDAKKFMILTLVPDLKFQEILYQSRIRCGFGLKENYWNLLMTQLLLNDLDVQAQDFESIKDSFKNHQLRYEFESFRVTCRTLTAGNNNNEDFIKLLVKFYKDFDEKMMRMSSYRIAQTFNLLGEKLHKQPGDG